MTAWHKQAICRGKDPEIFFPASDDRAGRDAAIAICGPCPVRAECRAEAGDDGIWGGEYFGKNEACIPRGRKKKPREHGTATGYQQHYRAGEDPCGPCIAAMREEWNRQHIVSRARKAVNA